MAGRAGDRGGRRPKGKVPLGGRGGEVRVGGRGHGSG